MQEGDGSCSGENVSLDDAEIYSRVIPLRMALDDSDVIGNLRKIPLRMWRKGGYSGASRVRVVHALELVDSPVTGQGIPLDDGKTSRQKKPEKMEKAVGIARFSGRALAPV